MALTKFCVGVIHAGSILAEGMNAMARGHPMSGHELYKAGQLLKESANPPLKAHVVYSSGVLYHSFVCL